MGNIGRIMMSAVVVAAVFYCSTVMAETIISPSYKINGNFGGSFGGQASSTSYKMSAIGGESIVGSGQSSSYIIDQQNPPSAEAPSLQLSLQQSGLVGYYPFDENTGSTVSDQSAYENSGTTGGSPAWNTGKMGSSLLFNGTSQNVTFGNPAHVQVTTGTVSAWVKSGQSTGTMAVVTKPSNFYLGITAGKLTTYDWNTSTSCTDTTTITDNAWHHIAVTFQSGVTNGTKLYRDGAWVKDCTMTVTGLTNNVYVGTSGAALQYFTGNIDHAKIYNRALSPTDITAEYTAQNAGNAGSTGVDLGALTPDASGTTNFDALVKTNNPYSLSISQNHDLRSPTTSKMPVAHTNTGDITRVPASQSNFNTVTLNKPANTADGDLLVAVVYFQNIGSPLPVITAPADWTRIGPALTTSTSNRPGGIYVLPVPSASALTEVSWVWSTSGAIGRAQGIMFRMTDAELDAYADAGNPSTWGTMATSTSLQYASMTVANPGSSLLLGYWVLNTSAGVAIPTPSSANLTVRDYYNTGTNTAVGNSQLGFATQGVSQGATGSQSINFSSAPTNHYGYTAAIVGRSYDRITPVTSTLASPAMWSEGNTKGLGFSLVSGPAIDAKWGSGTKFAPFPATPTTVYASNEISAMTKEVVSLRSRVAVGSSQVAGVYGNTVTITGTTIP